MRQLAGDGVWFGRSHMRNARHFICAVDHAMAKIKQRRGLIIEREYKTFRQSWWNVSFSPADWPAWQKECQIMRRSVISCVTMLGLAVATLLSVVGASSSAGTLPGRPASADVLEETTARVRGTCTTSSMVCTDTWLNAPNYCMATYGAMPLPFGAGGCLAPTGPRPCGDCTGATHTWCVSNLVSTFKCCQHNVKCCSLKKQCTTVGPTCGCVAAPAFPMSGVKLACYGVPLAFATPPGAPCAP